MDFEDNFPHLEKIINRLILYPINLTACWILIGIIRVYQFTDEQSWYDTINGFSIILWGLHGLSNAVIYGMTPDVYEAMRSMSFYWRRAESVESFNIPFTPRLLEDLN